MKTRTLSMLTTPALALTMALVIVGCDSDNSTTGSTIDGQHNGTGTADPAQGSGSTYTTTGTNTNTARNDDQVGTMETTEIRIVGSSPGTPIYNERYAASKDIRGYRALLMAELEAIRARLNEGTRAADVTQKDQDRAAVLAQGLERMDRLIQTVENSDDLTWTSIRESQLKEAGEVRTWATENGFRVS